jgi:uncharacterized protein YdaU (DUF1376 family)
MRIDPPIEKRLNPRLPRFLSGVNFWGSTMHYYQLNIGDYKSHTNHLDLLEDLAYRRLLDLYYLHERPLNVSVAAVARQIGMREHEDKVKLILEEFFRMSEDGWINPRADREIKHFHGKIEQASRAGKASAQRRSNARSTDVQPNNKQEPINKKQETKNTATSVATPDGVSPEVWDQFVKQRKVKKAQITDLVMAGIQREADKAGYTLEKALTEVVVRNWTSFKADWVAEKQQANGLTKTGLMNQTVMSGLTRGIMGSGKNVKFIEG